jgi:pseudouridine-5'-phosphate glycosidase
MTYFGGKKVSRLRQAQKYARSLDLHQGGTGGVHRGGELSLDISTDLIELSRTPVVVISAGVKSILDVKRTLEYLETFGVPTGTWKSDDFPAFFSPISGVKSPARFDSARDVASAYFAGKHLGMSNGILVVSYFSCSFRSAHGSYDMMV